MDAYQRRRKQYQDVSGSLVVTTTTDTTTLQALKVNYKIFVQRLHVTVTTGAAKTWTIADSNSTAIPVAGAIPTDVAPSDFQYDFGPEGLPLTVAKALVCTMSATGAAGTIVWEAYMKLTAAISINDGTQQ